jgi:amidase
MLSAVDSLAFRPAVELAGLVARREVSPVDVVGLFAERIERLDGRLNSVVTLDAERALALAKQQEALAGTDAAPPFLGVPILVKDLTMTAGLRTTSGNKALADHVPDFDDAHVTSLRTAGFVVLGKTNVPEWGTLPITESALLGPCRNPWNPEFTPGGSSGGAAAAAAAGLTPVAHGSDGAGSIRIPASNCGLFGIKPSRGRVTKAPLYGDGPVSFSTAGPLARTVADAAALLDVLRGPVHGDPFWAPEPDRPYAEDARQDPPRLHIGLVEAAPWAPYSPVAEEALRVAAELFERLGHRVEPCTLPLKDRLRRDFRTAWTVGLAANPVPPQTFEPYNAELARRGLELRAVDLLDATTSLQQQAAAIVQATNAFDAVCLPTLTGRTLRVGALASLLDDPDRTLTELEGYVGLTPVANITGQPSMALPLHTDGDLPFGVTVTGRPADESTLFRLAGQTERATGWPSARPPVS